MVKLERPLCWRTIRLISSPVELVLLVCERQCRPSLQTQVELTTRLAQLLANGIQSRGIGSRRVGTVVGFVGLHGRVNFGFGTSDIVPGVVDGSRSPALDVGCGYRSLAISSRSSQGRGGSSS